MINGTHVSICLCRLRVAVRVLVLVSTTGMYPTDQIYLESGERHPSRPFHLKDNVQYSIEEYQAARTIHNDLDILHKAIHDFQCLCRSRLSFPLGQPVQSLKYGFHIILPKELLPEFLCNTLRYLVSYLIDGNGAHSVVLLWLVLSREKW